MNEMKKVANVKCKNVKKKKKKTLMRLRRMRWTREAIWTVESVSQ